MTEVVVWQILKWEFLPEQTASRELFLETESVLVMLIL